MDRSTLIENTRNAFAFVQGLYDEVAALVRELEASLASQPERFVVNQPYGVAIRASKSLDPSNCKLWTYRKFGVFFVPAEGTRVENGQTLTPLSQPVLYLRFVLDDYGSSTFAGKPFTEPVVLFGTFTELKGSKKFSRFEHFPIHFEYNESKVFEHLPVVSYADARIVARGDFGCALLFDLTSPDEIFERVTKPALELFRRNNSRT